jgi:hypothetical protein
LCRGAHRALRVRDRTVGERDRQLQAPVAEITGDSHERLIARLIEVAGEIGYAVQIADTGPADGSCHIGRREIRIAERLAPSGRLVALIHELVAVD